MAYFPFMIEIKGHKALVVGAGQMAKDKIRALTEFGADVTVVAPVISADVVKQGKDIHIERRVYRPGETKGYEIVVAATDNRAVNKQVAHDAARFGAICTVADDPARGGFIFPEIIKRDNYSIAIMADGEDEKMSEKLAGIIGDAVPQKTDELNAVLGDNLKGGLTSEEAGQTQRLADMAPDAGNDQDEQLTQDEITEQASRDESGTVRVGSLDSRLSQVQADKVVSELMDKGFRCQKVLFRESQNDKPARILEGEDGSEIDITELDDALLSGDIDIAVRRGNDVPAVLAPQLTIAACLPRNDARDVLVTRKGTDKNDIESVAVSDPAEKVQIEMFLKTGKADVVHGDLSEVIQNLKDGDFDAVVTDAARFKELKLDEDEDLDSECIEIEKCLPAAGQGTLIIETRKTGRAHDAVCDLNDEDSMLMLTAEREYLKTVSADRFGEAAAYALLNSGMMLMKVMKYIGGRCVYFAGAVPADEGMSLAAELGSRINKSEKTI